MMDRIDEAIDRVASRLTHVDDDPAFASRIVSLRIEVIATLR